MMFLPMIDYFWWKLINCFGLVMKLAEDSRVVMVLVSCIMAVTFILNINSGRTILRDVADTMANRRLKAKLDRQPSPINIAENRVTRRQLKLPLKWTHYEDLPMATVLENNGSTVILRIYTALKFVPHLSGAELSGKYHFVEAIFKWGTFQSEHSIGKHRFCLEIQALHRCPREKGASEYLTLSYLLAVSRVKNESLMGICDNLKWILHPGSSIELPPFELGTLLRPFTGGHYTYHGTYDNGEVILPTIWLINPEISHVSSHQLAQFSALYRRDGSRISSNSRQEQPLGSRNVYFNI
ncbi:carbonic anhydrase 1 [Drosophila biarmipes]|uniref:carbonic anhydrase 1 n=1 Tax=Drosophila biarmipes TaxID=125945 RepID=UPI0007E65663|nr:carbonic anhydrase 1 [Drosophila biarmipes]XP_050743429.1 carbonic anhydrase 1 [Drosophila biarmipes]